MLFTPAAFPRESLAIVPTTEFWADGIAIDTPTPATMKGPSRLEYESPESAMRASQAVPTACNNSPVTISGRSPTRSTMEPTTGATVMKVAVQGIRRRPAPSGP